ARHAEMRGWRTAAPPELVAVLDRTHFAVPRRDSTHWMTLSPDGRLLAVPNGYDIILFDARTGLPRRTLTGHTSCAYRPAFSPDGRQLVSGAPKSLRGWDVASGRELFHHSELHTHDIWTVVYD